MVYRRCLASVGEIVYLQVGGIVSDDSGIGVAYKVCEPLTIRFPVFVVTVSIRDCILLNACYRYHRTVPREALSY